MSVELNHTIVRATDKQASAQFIAGILGVDVDDPWGPFMPVRLSNGVALEYVDAAEVDAQHYAFLVGDDEFDHGFARIQDAGIPYYADPFLHRPGEINHLYGGRGVYFHDPDGHILELITRPYGPTPE